MKHHLTRVSSNAKTGPIPVSTASNDTCPAACPLKGNGCYAEQGPLALHWRAVNDGRRGGTLDELCAQIRALPKGQLWRYGQAGDLPGDGQQIDVDGLSKLALANKGRRGFAYTHYTPTGDNAQAIQAAVGAGFTINLSANSLEHADELSGLGIAPVATLLPPEQLEACRTPAGRLVAVCPASVGDMDCARCGVCAAPHRKAIIGFPAHGSGAAKARKVFFMAQAV